MTSTPDSVWLVRHGESTWNALGLVQGQKAQPALTVRGEEQARKVAARLTQTVSEGAVRAVFCSDLQRARQTAEPVTTALGPPPVVDPRLRERSFGEMEGLPSRLLFAVHSGLEGERVADADASPPDGESVRDLYRRAAGFGRQVLANTEDGGDVVLVAHGGVVRVLLAWLDGVQPDDMDWGPVGNGLVVGRPLAAARRASEAAA